MVFFKVSLGAFPGVPNSHLGVMEILTKLSAYVPTYADGRLYPILTNSDYELPYMPLRKGAARGALV